MNRLLSILFMCALSVTISAQSGRPFQTVTIKPKSGPAFQCKWLKASADALELQCEQGPRTVSLEQIAAIEFAPTGNQPAPALSLDGLNEKQRAALRDAVLLLRKLNDATEVGVSRLQYKEKLAEAQTSVNTATMLLPDGVVKQQLLVSILPHVIANMAWDRSPRLTAESLSNVLSVPWKDAEKNLRPLIELTK